nr:MFS transporter [Clostridium sp. YIM B02551]
MKSKDIKMIYTIFVFVALAAFDNIIIGLFPPLFSSIAKDLNIQVSSLGIVSGVNILITAISSIYWGYLAGKYNRKILIIIGTIFWVVSVFLTSRANSYLELFIYQVFTGIGLGCIASIGFSVLTDYIPYKFRGMMLSLWGMSQGFGGILGAVMASLVAASSDWRKPFEIVSIIGLFLVILYVFVREPSLGEAEPELQELIKKGQGYNYSIKFENLKTIASHKSNILLFVQAFFMNITTGTLIWLPTLYISKILHEGYTTKTAIIAAGYLFALFQIGGLTSTYFGYLGDLAQRKKSRGRALLTARFVFLMMPLYIVMFLIPMKNLVLHNTTDPILILEDLIKQVFTNPWIGAIFVLSFLASAAQSANTPNWLAIITDVNLPEYRGAAFSIANLANGFGRTIGNTGVGVMLASISSHTGEPTNYIITLIIFQLFLIPSSLLYIKMSKTNERDIMEVKSILKKRADIL